MTSSDRRSLIVMRHAKAEPYADEDHARRLTSRGREGARSAGVRLTQAGLVPDSAWVSDAVRTTETWERVRQATGAAVQAAFEPALYAAGPESVLDFLRMSEPTAGTVLILGHNPTVAYLTHMLDDGSPDPAAWAKVSEGFPTAAAAVLDVPGEWADLEMGTCHLRDFQM